MAFEDRKYAIVDDASFQLAVTEGRINVGTLFEKILETSTETLRYSLDGTQFVVKADDEDDMAYLRQRASEESIGYTEMTHAECLALMGTAEWHEEDPGV
jgi:pyrroloquinoline quinone (PQQ) biosynthesis protein C